MTRALSIPSRPSFFFRLRQWVEPERFTKRGIVRIQMWGFVAAIFVTYPAYVVASDGWAEALQQPGVLGSAFGAACAAFVAVKTALGFLENSAKRAEKRDGSDFADTKRRLSAVESQGNLRDARISNLEQGQAVIHQALENIRVDQREGQRNVRSDIAELKAYLKGQSDERKKGTE